MLDGDLLLPVGLLHVSLQEMFVVLDGVVSEIMLDNNSINKIQYNKTSLSALNILYYFAFIWIERMTKFKKWAVLARTRYKTFTFSTLKPGYFYY